MRSALVVACFAALAVALAWPMQVTGDNQNAHYALVKALANGVPYIDDTLGETGDLQSHDVAPHGDHVYAVKAPGLAMASLPAYLAIEAVGMRTTGDPTRALWVLNLTTSVLATLVLLLLVRDLALRVEPDGATATATALALGALTLPFATLYFSHALGAALAFAAFWALWRGDRLRTAAGAGALLGLAVVVEHPMVWLAPILALYAAARLPRARRVLAFAAGAAVGVLPWPAFNLWAFGNPLHTAYDDYWRVQQNFDPVTFPRWSELSAILFSSLGLLVLAPIVGAGVAGAVLLYRRGLRPEALVCVAVPAVLIVYFSATGAFGGLGPPRYLTPIMPFLFVPVAAALRRWPVTTVCLAAIGCFQAILMTATGPLAAYDGQWLERVANRQFVATAAALGGISGWYAIAVFLGAAAAALALAAATFRPRGVTWTDAAWAIGAVAAWGVVALLSYNDYGRTPSAAYVLGVGLALAALALAAAAAGSRRTGADAVPER